MDKREESRRYMMAVGGEFEDRLGRHLSEEELIDYLQGRVDEAARERIQSHLVGCDACIAAFKDVSDFFEPAREGEETISEVETRREWKAVWQRVQSEARAGTGPQRLRPAGPSLRSLSRLALAASLILATLAAFWLVVMRQKDDIRPSPVAQSQEERLRQLEEENRRLQEQVGTTRQNYESQLAEQRNSEQEKLRRLEEENRRLREQAGTAQRNYESQLAELQRPQLNAQVYDILPQELIVRSGDESGANQITLPPGRQKFTLILNGAGLKAYPNYSIEIINQRGRTIWRGKGLKRGKDGNFVMTLDRTFLNKGEYRLKLYGQTDGGAQSAAEYRIVVNN